MYQNSSNMFNLLKKYRDSQILIDDDLLKLFIKYINEMEYTQSILEEHLDDQEKIIKNYQIKYE